MIVSYENKMCFLLVFTQTIVVRGAKNYEI